MHRQSSFDAAFYLSTLPVNMMAHETDHESQDWREYFTRYGPRLLLFARQWLPDVADAEDAIQESFVRFWRKYRSPADEHAGLLFASVRTVALDHIRSETRRRRRETVASDEQRLPIHEQEKPSLFNAVTAGEASPMEGALRQLPAEQREVLVLKIWGELTFAQIAEALELSPNTAASRYRYAINGLKKILHPVCDE